MEDHQKHVLNRYYLFQNGTKAICSSELKGSKDKIEELMYPPGTMGHGISHFADNRVRAQLPAITGNSPIIVDLGEIGASRR